MPHCEVITDAIKMKSIFNTLIHTYSLYILCRIEEMLKFLKLTKSLVSGERFPQNVGSREFYVNNKEHFQHFELLIDALASMLMTLRLSKILTYI